MEVCCCQARGSQDKGKTAWRAMSRVLQQLLCSRIMRRFIIDSLKGYQRNIAMRFVDVDEEEEDEEESACTKRWRYLWFGCLILYFMLSCFYVFLFGVRLGPAGVNLWLTGVGFAFMQACLILQPVRIFMFHVAVAAISAKRVRVIHGVIRERVKGVLSRTAGLMSGANSLVQHLNPACRAARARARCMWDTSCASLAVLVVASCCNKCARLAGWPGVQPLSRISTLHRSGDLRTAGASRFSASWTVRLARRLVPRRVTPQ